MEAPGGLLCPRCGARYPRRWGFPDLRLGRGRPLLTLVNALPPVALGYELWRVRSTGLLSGGRLSFGEELEALTSWLLPTGGPFLDVGTGTGVYLRALGGEVGIDPSPAFLKVARRRFPQGVYLLARAEALPFPDGAFSGVAFGPTWNEVEDPEAAAREAFRVLRRGGRLFTLLLLGEGRGGLLYRPGLEGFLGLLRGAGFRAFGKRVGRIGLVRGEVV